VIRDRHFKTLGAVVLDVEGEGFLEEPEADVVLSDRVQDEADVGVDEGQLGVVLPADHEGDVASSVEELEGSGDLSVGEAVERQVGVLGDRVGVVDAVHSFTHQDGFLLARHSLHMVSHDVIQPCEHSEALCDFRVIAP